MKKLLLILALWNNIFLFADSKLISFSSSEVVSPSPKVINDSGYIAGSFFESIYFIGFLRTPEGEITRFKIEGSRDTLPESMNSNGDITGSFRIRSTYGYGWLGWHGFIRNLDGQVTTFDPKDSVATSAMSINSNGAVAGYFLEVNKAAHGFIREPNGEILTFDPEGSKNTFVQGINSEGTLTGLYLDEANISHGFLRYPDGEIVSFEVLGLNKITSINSSGTILGDYYFEDNLRGFLRNLNGEIITFEVPGALSTSPQSLNDNGYIAGWYEAQDYQRRGFVRDPAGGIMLFEEESKSKNIELKPISINSSGSVTGVIYSGEFGERDGFVKNLDLMH